MLVGGRHTTVAQWLPWSRTFQGGEGRHAIKHEEILQRGIGDVTLFGAVVQLLLRLGRQPRTPHSGWHRRDYGDVAMAKRV